MLATPFLLSAFPLALIAAAISDLRRFIIPNWTSLLLIAGFVVAYLGAAVLAPGYGLAALGAHLGVGLAAFLCGFALWALGLWGGGDGKLFAAAALWFDPFSAVMMLLWVAIAGGGLALLALALHQWRHLLAMLPCFNLNTLDKYSKVTPYGVAIAIGALVALPESPLFKALAG